MGLSRRTFITRSTALAALGGVDPASNAASEVSKAAPAPGGATVTLAPATLHGYGTLAATFRLMNGGRSSLTRITCESAQKALLTQAKYLSDLERLPGLEKGSRLQGSRSLPFRRTRTGGVVACYARGREVLILAGMDEAALARLCDASLPPSARAADFEPRVPIPMYLDRWDKYGLLCYFAPDVTALGTTDQTYDYADALKFARDHGPLGLVVWTNPLTDDHAEGLTNEQSWDWVQTNARKMGIPMHINTQISLPQLWLGNRYREQTMLKTPQFIGGYYGVGHDSAGIGAISWLSQEAEDAQLGIFQHTVRRFAKDPNIVGWLEPHGETGEMPQRFFLEAGPYADEILRGFLRKRYRTLRALSERWHGNADHYKSWNEVYVPEVAEFAGFGPDAIDLQGAWRVRYVPAPDGHAYTQEEARNLPSPPPAMPVPDAWYQPGFDDSDWDELIAPGNDRMLFMKRSPLVYRRTLTIPTDWLASALLASGPRITLVVWDLVNRQSDVTTVYVNGQKIVEQSHNANDQHWSQFDVTVALKPGPNLLAIQMPRAIVCYRAYLTKEPLGSYPHLGPHKNAQWADMVEWNIESRGAQIRRGAEMIRQVDPDSSINFMAANDYAEPIKTACQDYGGRFHDTGAMAGYWTDWNTLMMCGAGLPVTAEAGNGAPNIREFQLFWGRWLTEGLTGIHYFQNWGEIAWNPDILKVFEANQTMYEAVGKYHVPFARVASLYSLRNEWLTAFPWAREPGSAGGYESTFNAASQLINYCPRDGIGAADFGTPVVDKYRVIIDSNTSFMDDELLHGIEKFVRNGGVFITNGQTGRHDLIKLDTWPITRLTGYEVTRITGWGDGKSVSPAAGQTVFGPAEMPAPIRAAGLALKPVSPDCHTLAVWDDGTTAIGMRSMGAGWVIHFGPMLFGASYLAMMTPLLRHFGVTERVPATVTARQGLHFRHFIGNTGLHDVWVLFNESDSPTTTDLTFLPGVHPPALTDIVSGQQPDIARNPSGDTIHGIALDRWQSRMFLSPRADTPASPLEWLKLQRGWWQGTVKPPAKRLPTPAEMQRFSVDLTAGWTCKNAAGLNDEQAAALARPDVDDSNWERRQLALWLTPGDKNSKRLLLRRKFTVPAHWTAGQIGLCADLPGEQFFGQTRTFLDGNPWQEGRKSVDGPYFDNFGGALKPGMTHLLTLDIQSNGTLMGSRGPIWLTYLPDAQERQDLSGSWTAYADPLHKTGNVTLPGTVKGVYLSRAVVIEAAHKGRNVVIYFEATGDRFSLMINGRLLNSSELVRGHVFAFNVTPFIRFGEENRIELVGKSGSEPKTIPHVEIRYYEKGVYP